MPGHELQQQRGQQPHGPAGGCRDQQLLTRFEAEVAPTVGWVVGEQVAGALMQVPTARATVFSAFIARENFALQMQRPVEKEYTEV